MRMEDIDIVLFPRFTAYVEKEIVKFAAMDSVKRAFARYGQIDGPTLKKALTWRQGPLIIITDLEDGVFGEFNLDSPEEVRIDIDRVLQYESGGGIATTPKLGNVPRIAVTLLHELVHWADAKDGKDYGGKAIDEGTRFEIKVLGTNVS